MKQPFSLFTSVAIIIGAVVLAACSSTTNSLPQSSSSSTPSTTQTVTPTTTSASNATASPKTSYTLADVATHNSPNDCWLVIDTSVYDVTDFIPNHPGGEEILKGCGKDATSLFASERKHSGPEAQSYLPPLKIGELQQ